MIRARVDELIDRMLTAGQADLVRDFACELAVGVIMMLLGAPLADLDRIKQWSDGGIALVWGLVVDDEQIRLAADLVEFWRYCEDLVADRVVSPHDDLVTSLLNYRGGHGEALSEREVASVAFNLLIAGHETASSLLSNALLHLLSGDGWNQLVTEPERIPNAVEEILRYDSPVAGWLRLTTREVTLHGVRIPAGARLLLMLGSANRDEAWITDGERLDLRRPRAGEHLSFGLGRHFCPGAALARLESRLALEELVHRLPGLRLRDDFDPSYAANVALRTLQSLPVVWG